MGIGQVQHILAKKINAAQFNELAAFSSHTYVSISSSSYAISYFDFCVCNALLNELSDGKSI